MNRQYEDRGVGSRPVSREQSPAPHTPVKQSNNIGRYIKHGLVPLAAAGLIYGVKKYGPKIYNSLTSFNKSPKLNPNITNYLN